MSTMKNGVFEIFWVDRCLWEGVGDPPQNGFFTAFLRSS